MNAAVVSTPLDGCRAIVTGAGRGIGRAIALAFARAGSAVVCVDKDADGAAETAGQLREAGRSGWAVSADVTDAAQVADGVAEAVGRLGGLDIFVNNAGILRAGDLVSASLDDWDAQFNVNTRAAYLCVKAAAQRMLAQASGGAIVIVTSNCAYTPRMDLGAYCASKAATDMMAKCLALELAEHDIRVNTLCPGSCDTDLQRKQWERLGVGPERQIRGSLEKFRSGIPMGRLAMPEDVADMAVMLASPASRFVTGQSITVDGGQTTR